MPTLSEIYQNLHKYNSVIFEDTEPLANITVKFAKENEVKKLSLPDTYARKVLGYAGRLSENMEKHLTDWIKAAEWGTQAQQFLKPALMNAFQSAFNMDDIETVKNIINAIKDLTEQKQNITSLTETINLTSDTSFLSFFQKTIQQIPSVKIFNNQKFIDSVIKFEFSEAKVGVGPGEVFLTLFSEAVNPKKGDIFIPSIEKEIELKADGGRAGKSDVVNKTTNMLKDLGKYVGSNISEIKNTLLDELFILAEPFRNILKRRNTKFNTIITMALNKDKKILNLKELTQLAELRNIARVGENDYGMLLVDSTLPQQISNKLEEIGKLKEGSETTDFKTYFQIVDRETAIKTISDFMINPPKQLSVIERYYDKLSPDQIVAAIQINDYQKAEKFDYIVYFNQNNKKMLPIGPFDDEYLFNLERILSVAHKFKVTVSTGGGRGGFNVYI